MKTVSKIFTALLLLAFVACNNEELTSETLTTASKITECETAYAVGDRCFLEDGFNRWGWVIGPVVESETKTVYEIYAAAGKCVLENGTLVGHLYIAYYDGMATITYDALPGYLFTETHLYVGDEMYPLGNNGRPTVAPGQYPYSDPIDNPTHTDNYVIEHLEGEIYVIAHAVVCPGKIIKE